MDIGLYKDIKPASQEEKIFDEVPQDLIDYNFIFEEDWAWSSAKCIKFIFLIKLLLII